MKHEIVKKYGLTRVIARFDSYGALLEYAENRVAAPSAQRLASRSLWMDSTYRTATFNDALELAHKGWEEGRNKIKDIASRIENKVMSLVEVPQLNYSVTGNDFDMGLLMQGVPEHWYTIENTIQEGTSKKVLKLVYNVSASMRVNSETIIARGAVAAALVACLENVGFRIEVWINRASTESGITHEIYSCIKQADQPLDIDRLSFAMVHPSSLRRIMWSVTEASEEFMSVADSSYGSPCSMPIEEQGDIYFNGMSSSERQWLSTDTCVRWVIEELKRQGVEITGQV